MIQGLQNWTEALKHAGNHRDQLYKGSENFQEVCMCFGKMWELFGKFYQEGESLNNGCA